jgi:SAM-dependent methyltransferase
MLKVIFTKIPFFESFLSNRKALSIVNSVRAYLAYLREYCTFKNLSGVDSRFRQEWKDRYPRIYDKTSATGFDRHYIYHPAWAARIVAQNMPAFHVDISSTLHFCTIVSAFVPVKFYDYRPADIQLPGLDSEAADLLSLPFANDSIISLSCMHVVEHVGLGRYGEPLDPDGDLKAVAELKRVLAPGGSLLFVVPIGKPIIAFNAHRIYSYDQVVTCFSELKLREFTLIPDTPDDVGPILQATREFADNQTYGCGCFWFKKDDNDKAPKVLQ